MFSLKSYNDDRDVGQISRPEDRKRILDDIEKTVTTYKDAGRTIPAAERAEIERALDLIQSARDTDEIKAQIDAGRAGSVPEAGTGGLFAKALHSVGFDYKANPSVEIPLSTVLGAKASTVPAVTDWNRTTPFVAPLGQDQRFLHPALRQENAGDAASVQFFRQTGSRTVTGTVERALNATTDKATLGVTLTTVNEALVQEAIVIDGIPNAVLESIRMSGQFFNNEGRFQIGKALDAHVMAKIVAATPPFGMTGTTLVDKVRNGVASMRADGFNPDILVLNPSDAAGLDLLADAGGYVFPTRDAGVGSPLWGLRVVERIGAGTEAPYLIDTSAIGALHLGTLRVDADPYAGAGGKNFVKNLTDLRFEVKALFAVEQATAARRIAAA